jgi:hypothetical protein
LLGVGSALFVLGISLNYKYYTPSKYQQLKEKNMETERQQKEAVKSEETRNKLIKEASH